MTSTDLANMALGNFGNTRIDDIESTTSIEAKACNFWYANVRETYLRNTTPNFARADVALAIAADEESEIYDFVYAYPSDCINASEIWNGGVDPRIVYEVGSHSSGTSKVIVTNQGDAVLVYTRDITNLNMFNADHINAMAFLFSEKIIMELKRDRILAGEMNAKYIQAIALALRNDKREQFKAMPTYSKIPDSRV